MTAPVSRRREHTRARLLDAAASVFAEVGLEGASVEAICERAGFTRGAFYSNFESKDELFLQLASDFAERRLAQVRTRLTEFAEAGALHGDADLVSLLQQVMDSGEDDRLTVLMMSEIRIRALRDETFGAAYLGQERELVASIEEIIQNVVDEGLLSLRVNVHTAARMLMTVWSDVMTLGAIERLSDAQLRQSGSESLGAVVAALVRGD